MSFSFLPSYSREEDFALLVVSVALKESILEDLHFHGSLVRLARRNHRRILGVRLTIIDQFREHDRLMFDPHHSSTSD